MQKRIQEQKSFLKSTYMDDNMDSVMDETEGVELYKELSELWQKAGMQTHKSPIH